MGGEPRRTAGWGQRRRPAVLRSLLQVVFALLAARGAQADKPAILKPQPVRLVSANETSNIMRPEVVGGLPAPAGRYPYQVGLSLFADTGEQFLCGGVLIREDVVLTAGHCAGMEGLESVVVNYGAFLDSPVFKPNASASTNATAFFAHEAFDLEKITNDVGLVFLNKCVAGLSGASVVRFASKREYNAAVTKRLVWTATGFGATSEGTSPEGDGDDGELAQVLQVARLDYVRPRTCRAFYLGISEGAIDIDPLTTICMMGKPAAPSSPAGPPFQSICSGDSGGPLTFSVNPAAKDQPMTAGTAADDRLVAVTSWGVGCGLAQRPAGFTNALFFKPWIDNQLAAQKPLCATTAVAPDGTVRTVAPSTLGAFCVRVSRNRNFDVSVPANAVVTTAPSFEACCGVCRVRAEGANGGMGGCKAFSVSVTPTGQVECHIYTRTVPAYICKAGRAANDPCRRKSLGAGRISWN